MNEEWTRAFDEDVVNTAASACRPRRRTTLPFAVFLGVALCLAAAGEVHAQFLGQGQAPPQQARSLMIGVKAGLDNSNLSQRFVLGVLGSVTIDPWNRLALMGGYDLRFLRGHTEKQFTADAIILLSQLRALYVGGGAVFRNTFPEGDLDERQSFTGFSLVGGLRGGTFLNLFVTQVEVRYVEVEGRDNLVLTLGFLYRIPLGF